MRGDGAGVYTGEQAGRIATQILTNTLPNLVANDIKSFLASSARGGGGREGAAAESAEPTFSFCRRDAFAIFCIACKINTINQ